MFSRGKHPYTTGFSCLILSGALLLAGCSGDSKDDSSAAPIPEAAPANPDPAAPELNAPAPTASAPAPAGSPASASVPGAAVKPGASAKPGGNSAAAPSASGSGAPAPGKPASSQAPGGSTPAPSTPGAKPAPAPGGALGASDVGVTSNEIKLGSISSVNAPMGKYIAGPVTKAAQATIDSINDNGGILGRKLTLTDCDDAGDIARFRACYRKLVQEQKVFSLVTSMTFGSGEVHGDLARDRIPWIGDIGWYGSSWTDPWMIPMYMSAVADASATSEWIASVAKPKKVGILYLNTPEMKAAADEVTRVLKTYNIPVVKALQQELDTPDESPNVLQMRQAGVDHITTFSWPPPVIKFIIDAAQQGYWPEKGMSGNHLVAEVVPQLVGKWPLNRWWNASSYQVWGTEYEAIMKKYAPGLSTLHFHNTQTAYMAMRLLKEAGQEVGPNLTREALMKVLESRQWDAGPGLGQTFLWKPDMHDTLRCNYMFKYTSMEAGSSKVWTPDPTQFKNCGSLPQRPLAAKR